MNQYKKWFNKKKAERIAENLKEKGYEVTIALNCKEAKEQLLKKIPEGSTIGLGGSQTIAALDVLDDLRSDSYNLFDPYNCHDYYAVCRDSLLSDVFITGTNAVTEKGELVNVDCSGNRTAAMMYGPQKVIVIFGVNKLVKDINAAFQRIREIAPMNAVKEDHHTPCRETGFCIDCKVLTRGDIRGTMCNHIGITLNAWKFEGRMHAIVIAEELGF
jgi:hypothetical protein